MIPMAPMRRPRLVRLDMRRPYQHQGRKKMRSLAPWGSVSNYASAMAKELPTDAKTERLLNLVLALLSSKRFLRKSEILALIPGYEGTPESRERMFERDKDELRKIGIPIQVSQIDPLFEDEVGYRIPADEYLNRMPPLSPSESLVASLALRAVADLVRREGTSTTSLKIDSFGHRHETALDRIVSEDLSAYPDGLSITKILIPAIKEHQEISFGYETERDGRRSKRIVEPIQLRLRGNLWQLLGWDVERAGLRTFLLDQITDTPERTGRVFTPREPQPDEGSAYASEVISFTLPLANAPLMEAEGARLLSTQDGLAIMESIPYNVDRFLRILIAASPGASILSPTSIREEFLEVKKRLIDAIR